MYIDHFIIAGVGRQKMSTFDVLIAKVFFKEIYLLDTLHEVKRMLKYFARCKWAVAKYDPGQFFCPSFQTPLSSKGKI